MASGYGFITIQVDANGPIRKLATWGAMITDLRPAWDVIGAKLRYWWAWNFTEQGGTIGMGGPWKALKPSTVADRERKGYFGPAPILFRDGTLFASLVDLGGANNVFQATPTRLVIGTDLFYAGFHQRGTSRMVKRPIVGISKHQGFDIIQTLNNWIQVQAAGAWKRA